MSKPARVRRLLLAGLVLGQMLAGCSAPERDPAAVTMLIESSPANLDPRIGIDAQSERIYMLIFDALVRRDQHFNVQPWLAESWTTPDPLTYVFHLRRGVRFHDGRALTSADVKWTLDSMRNGEIVTSKSATYATVERIDAPDDWTVVIHLKRPEAALLWNLSDGAFGVVPRGSGRDFGLHPIGSGPFRLVRQEQDKEVVLERNPGSWQPLPAIHTVRFAVVPDAITRALEMEKGSADVCINALTADMTKVLATRPSLAVESAPGTVLSYLAFNTRDPILKDKRVRQAIAYAMNRPLMIRSLWRGRARPAESLLPPDHWAWAADLPHHDYDPALANRLLDAAGFRRDAAGVRFHLALKTSTDESSRLLAMVLQQQLREAGIALDVRSFEFATFYSDITKGAFQMYTLRWIGGNEDPDIFRYAYSTASFPPHGANRGYYSNAEVDALLRDAAASSDQAKRREDYDRLQHIAADEMPSINLWYLDTVLVYNRRLTHLHPSSSGNYDFLRQATFAH